VLVFPFVGDVGDVIGTAFVVEYIQLNSDAAGSEVLHDPVIGWDSMWVGFLFEWLDEDGVGANVMSQHDVVVATGGFDREAAHIICVERRYLDSVDM
jgi:hypothetical protein